MSDFPPVEPKVVAKPIGYRPPQPIGPPNENGFGIAGFITSVIGLITCGSLSIFAILLSAIGLRKEPRGLAIAGLMLGLVGIVELLVVCVVLMAVWRTSAVAIGGAQSFGTRVILEKQANLIGEQWRSGGELPTQEAGDRLVKFQRDSWGRAIEYETDGSSFSLRSSGRDGVSGNQDDVVVGPFADPDAAQRSQIGFNPEELEMQMDDIQSEIEKEMKKLEQQMKQQQEQLENRSRF